VRTWRQVRYVCVQALRIRGQHAYEKDKLFQVPYASILVTTAQISCYRAVEFHVSCFLSATTVMHVSLFANPNPAPNANEVRKHRSHIC
jgi:hypothetical protein